MISNPPNPHQSPDRRAQGGRGTGGNSREEGTPGVSKGKFGGTWGKGEGVH